MKKATQARQPLPHNTRPKSTSTESQNLRLLAYLLNHDGGINRFEGDALLNICHVAARAQDLEAKGCRFIFEDEIAADLLGRPHNGIRRYWLKSAPAHLLRAANDEGKRHEP